MSRWGKVDYKEFLQFADGLEKLSRKGKDEIMTEMINDSVNRFLQVVVDNTPEDTGHLKGAWGLAKIYKQGGNYIAEIVNTMPYATFVEYGHRTVNGGWVEGRFFVKYAIDDLERVSQSLFDRITVRKFEELGLIK